MDAIWSRGFRHFSVSEVLAVLEKRRDIAYTTVMTTVGRLHEKGLLKRERDGKRYLYEARVTREAFLQQTAREVLQQIGEPWGVNPWLFSWTPSRLRTQTRSTSSNASSNCGERSSARE